MAEPVSAIHDGAAGHARMPATGAGMTTKFHFTPSISGTYSFWTGRRPASINPALLACPVFSGLGAQVAQLVEHAIENRSVGGSIPPLGTITFLHSFA